MSGQGGAESRGIGFWWTMFVGVVLLVFGVPIAAACTAFVVMACRMQNEENAKLAAQHK